MFLLVVVKKNFHFDLRTNLPFVLVCKFLFFSSFPCLFFSSFFLWKENAVVSVERMFPPIERKFVIRIIRSICPQNG